MMRTALRLATAAIAAAAAPPSPAAPPVPAAAAQEPIVTGTSYRLNSAVLGDRREINVRLPAGYARGEARYPVVYLIDGGRAQDFGHIAGLAELGELNGTYGPVILVGVETRNRRAELTPPATDARYRSAFPEAGGAERFRRFLAQEVIPFVESRFRTGERRAVVGESLAGLFVVDTLLKAPALFHDYAAISPSLWWDDRLDMRRAGSLIQPRQLGGRRLFLAAADEGGTMQDGIDRLRAALARSAPASFALRYADKSRTETHLTILHGAAQEAFRWLYAAPPYDFGPTPWFMKEGASPPE